MIDLKKEAIIGSEAVKRLRLDKLRNGKAFMINSKNLPAFQSYREYPDGKIELVELNQAERDFRLVRILSDMEVMKLKVELGF
jgi:hypothetical protein